MGEYLNEKECKARYYTSERMPAIIDAHAHLWLWQNAKVCGKKIEQRPFGRSMFLGTEVQMMSPWLEDNRNSAERMLAQMDFAQVQGAVITQEFIDGLQNDYLEYVHRRWPERFFTYGMCEFRRPGFLVEFKVLVRRGCRGVKLCAGRLADQQRMDQVQGSRLFASSSSSAVKVQGSEVSFTNEEFMEMYHEMEEKGMILGLELCEGDGQNEEVEMIVRECPNLKIVLGHFCMVNRPGWQKQMALCRYNNVYADMGGITWLFNDEYYPYPSAVKAIRESIDMVGVDKLLWGSDYPRTISNITYRQSYDWILKSSEFTDDEKAKLLGQNAIKLYGFTPKPVIKYIPNMSE